MSVEQRPQPALRASDRDRDEVLVRLHTAFAEGRLSESELDGPVTTIRVRACKSTVEITVPPGTRVEVAGMGVSAEVNGVPAAGAPVVRIQGLAYKGAIEERV